MGLGSCGSELAEELDAPAPAISARHLRQNFAVGGLPAPHDGQTASKGALHYSQKGESARFSVLHLGHSSGQVLDVRCEAVGVRPRTHRAVEIAGVFELVARVIHPPVV